MRPEPGPWTPPAAVRALLWWPPIALLLAAVAPHAAPLVIAAAGGVLAAVGMVGAALHRLAGHRAPDVGPLVPAEPAPERHVA